MLSYNYVRIYGDVFIFGGTMLAKTKVIIFIVISAAVTITGCAKLNPVPPIQGIDEPIVINGISFSVIEARIRKSYSTFYIMKYPPENTIFYGWSQKRNLKG